MVENDKMSHSITQEIYIIWSWFLVQTFKMMASPDAFFIFSKVWGGLKGKKMAQKNKKFCLSHSVSQEPYLIWLWFLVHRSNMMISSARFFIFSKVRFFVRVKKWPITINFSRSHPVSLRTVDHIIKIFGTKV